MPLTDEQIDSIIEQQKPNLRSCYRAMFENNQPWVALKMGQVVLQTGGHWDIMMLWAAEPMAKLIEGTLGGYMGLMKSMSKTAPQQPAPPPQPVSSAFGL